MTDPNIEEWFKNYEPKYVEEVNVYPNITTFNRKLYTFGPSEGEVYIKFKSYDANIKSYDEVCYLDTESCVWRVAKDRYICTAYSSDETKVAIIGELGQRYIQKNKFDSYNLKIKSPEEWEVVPITEVYDYKTVTAEELCKRAQARITLGFEDYFDNIRIGTLNSSSYAKMQSSLPDDKK
ncbi:hypothetical protein I9W82_005603 [Candida metapsilosis]|uniref:Uncharacterized protein n=1 Tax=Candida metapsilosis TaxID=273372 RepID=A0A8H8D8A3_9ASCO|nr:hypothetical protein I9W82_005603 [Candida metapsilosis]